MGALHHTNENGRAACPERASCQVNCWCYTGLCLLACPSPTVRVSEGGGHHCRPVNVLMQRLFAVGYTVWTVTATLCEGGRLYKYYCIPVVMATITRCRPMAYGFYMHATVHL